MKGNQLWGAEGGLKPGILSYVVGQIQGAFEKSDNSQVSNWVFLVKAEERVKLEIESNVKSAYIHGNYTK